MNNSKSLIDLRIIHFVLVFALLIILSKLSLGAALLASGVIVLMQQPQTFQRETLW
jgi:hypothetical protein